MATFIHISRTFLGRLSLSLGVLTLLHPMAKALPDNVPSTSRGGPIVGDPGLPIESCFELAEGSTLELAAITPVNPEQSLTLQDTPTLYFYIPYTAESVSSGEFMIRHLDFRQQPVYRERLALEGEPGLFSFTLPSPPSDNHGNTSYLSKEEYYSWQLKLYCTLESGEVQERVVGGLIAQAEIESELSSLSLHYDSIQDTVEQIAAGNRPETEWTELLQSLGIQLEEWFADRPELNGEEARAIVEAYSTKPTSPTNGVNSIQLDE